MSGLRRFTCWDRDRVNDVIRTEADAPSNATFLATHVTTPIFRRLVGTHSRGTLVSEQDVLDEMVALPIDMPIVPILGKSGTGKSHLVKWLHAHLESTKRRRIVWIPKYSTSLRGVVEQILKEATGPEFDEIRAKVREATEGLTDHAARLKMLSTLSTSVELYGSGAADAGDHEERKYLANRLPALLNDPVFKDTLLSDGAALSRVVKEKLQGRGLEDKDEPFAFKLEDLPLQPTDVSKAGETARHLLKTLVVDEHLQQLAVDLMNEQLDTAIRDVFGLGGGQLFDLMMKLRQLLHARGNELVLLIEDFTILQGLQGELLDAIIEAPVRGGKQELCTMRVVMAVTTGYFEKLFPTVRTRTLNEYVLDVRMEDLDEAAVREFVAVYLNAARLGGPQLDKEYERARHEKGWIPNACDKCPAGPQARDMCHAGFGQQDGRGLYPFNRAALRRAIRSQPSQDGEFNARTVLTKVLRPTLDNYLDDIREGEFPNTEFADQFYELDAIDVSVPVQRAIDQRDPRDAARRKVLLNFWGDVPEQISNLPEGVHVAFDLPPLDSVPTIELEQSPKPQVGPKPRTKPPDGEQIEVRPDSRPPLVIAVEDWNRTKLAPKLSQQNELRHMVHRSVVTNMDLENGFWRSTAWTVRSEGGDKGYARPTAFRHERVLFVADNREPEEPTLLLDSSNTDDAAALQALAWFEHQGDWRFPDGAELQRLLVRRVDAWTEVVRRQLLPLGLGGDAPNPLPALVCMLLIGARVLGLPGSESDDPVQLLRALVHPGPTLMPVSPDSDPWSRLRYFVTAGSGRSASRGDLRAQLLRLASYSQDGEPQAIDAMRLLQLVKATSTDWALPNADPTLPGPVNEYLKVLREQLPAATLDRYHQLRRWLEVVEPLLPAKDEFADVVKSVNVTLQDASAHGLLPSGIHPEQLDVDGRTLVAAKPSHLVSGVHSALEGWDQASQGQRLRSLATDWEPQQGELRAYLVTASNTLERIDKSVAQMIEAGSKPGGSVTGGIDTAFAQLEQQLTELARPGRRGPAK